MMILELNNFIDLASLTKAARDGNAVILHQEAGSYKCCKFEIDALKETYGECIAASLHYAGSLLLEMGIESSCRSYRWCGEQTLAAEKESTETFEINLAEYDSGILEIYVRALEKESVLYCHAALAEAKEPDCSQVLYDFLFPSYELCSEKELYYRIGKKEKGVYYSFEKKCIHLAAGSSVDLVTYFNAFSACKWKQYTNVADLAAFLDFEGRALVQLVHVAKDSEGILGSWSLQAEQRSVLQCPINNYPDAGIIGLRLYADKDCVLYGGGYLTDDEQTQAVHLGIGITTFRREKAVAASVARLGRAIAAHPLYRDAIDITVVDNGQTLSQEDLPCATLIPNANLGGSGGFMRSLIHYQDAGSYTHCVFMDDDASCEPGCVFRSISFLRHANDTSITIAGAMLLESDPGIQWEKSAFFETYCKPLHCGYDVRNVQTLAVNELEDSKSEPVYAAWWFCMFPLKEIEMSVFPYFVRGDDIEFSYANKLNIVTMNGICSLQGDFRLKECPSVHYLEYRSHILLIATLSHISNRLNKILACLWKSFKYFNFSYHYDSANTVILSLKNTMKGPDFWIDDIDTTKIRKYIKNKYKIEVLQHVDNKQKITVESDDLIHPFFKKVKVFLSLNGHLLPSAMLDDKDHCINKLNEYNVFNMYGRKSVFVYDAINNTGYTLKRDCRYFFKNIALMAFYTVVFIAKYPFVKAKYRSFYKKLKNGAFWRSLYRQNGDGSAAL